MSSVFHHNWKGQAGQILRQAWPVLVGSWAGIAFGVLDTVMVGHSSPIDLQAMGLPGGLLMVTSFVTKVMLLSETPLGSVNGRRWDGIRSNWRWV